MPFFTTLQSLHQKWSEGNGSYSHGYILILVVVYLLYRRVREWPETVKLKPCYWFLGLSLGCVFVWLVGFATQVQLLEQMAMPALLWTWVGVVFGWRAALHLVLPFLLLYLAIPLWEFLLQPLRAATVGFSQFWLELMAIPALIDGFVITLPTGILAVAGGCAGLNYLLVALVIGTVNSLLAFNRMKYHLVAIGLVVAFALLANWVRVLLLVLIAYYSDMESSLVKEHGTFGWLVFGVFMMPYFLLIHKYESIIVPKVSAVNNNAARKEVRLPIVSGGMTIASAVIIVCIGVVPLWAKKQSVTTESTGAGVLSHLSSAGFELMSSGDFWVPDYENYDVLESYATNIDGVRYEAVALTYLNQSQGKELIYYKNALAGEYNLRHLEPIQTNAVTMNRSVIRVGGEWRIVWWSYKVGEHLVDSQLAAKLWQFPALFQGENQASLIALSRACSAQRCEVLLQNSEVNEPQKVLQQLISFSKD